MFWGEQVWLGLKRGVGGIMECLGRKWVFGCEHVCLVVKRGVEDIMGCLGHK